MTAPDDGPRRRSFEFSLGARHILLAALLVAAGIIVARMWTSRPPESGGKGARQVGGATAVEDLGDSETVFDREGGAGGPKPAPGRQVAPGGAGRGRWELDLGSAADREEAERIAGLVRDLGFPAHAVRTRTGHRIGAGPFDSEAEARRAAERLRDALKRAVYVHGPP